MAVPTAKIARQALNAVQLRSFLCFPDGLTLWRYPPGPIVFATGLFVFEEANQSLAPVLYQSEAMFPTILSRRPSTVRTGKWNAQMKLTSVGLHSTGFQRMSSGSHDAQYWLCRRYGDPSLIEYPRLNLHMPNS